MSGNGKLVNLGDLAAILGVSRPTVQQYVKQGCPFVTRADRKTQTPWEFDTAAVIAWDRDRQSGKSESTDGVTTTELERRKLAADTQLKELDAAQKRGELGSLDEFRRQVAGMAVETRQRLLQIPKRVEPNDRERRAMIETEILEALSAIADEFGGE